MSTGTLPPGAVDRRYTDAEFEAMVGAGIIRDGSRTFLWDGRVVEPMAEGEVHREVKANILDLLVKALPAEEWSIYTAPTTLLRPGFRPLPDIVVARGPRSRYKGRLLVPIAAAKARVIQRFRAPDAEAGRYQIDTSDSGRIPFDRHNIDVEAAFFNT